MLLSVVTIQQVKAKYQNVGVSLKNDMKAVYGSCRPWRDISAETLVGSAAHK